MSYLEPKLQLLYNTGTNYNASTGDIVATEAGGVGIEIYEFGAVVTTAFVTTTSLVLGLDITAADRVTKVVSYATLTIPTGAVVGAIYQNRLTLPVTVFPSGIFTITCVTQGVGSAGVVKPYVVYRFIPQSDQSNVNAVTA